MSKRKHNQRKIEKGSLLSLFKKSHPVLAGIVSIIVGMCGVLGFALTALALLAPDVLEAATSALSISSEGTFVGFITVFPTFINARDNQPLCMYFASSFLLFSGGMVSFIIACVAVMLNCIRARREEHYLAETYGDWRDYRDHTPFMFPKLR